MFQAGERIAYPLHGVGYIEEIQEDIYYIIHIPHGDVKIRIPKERAEDAGVRALMQKEELELCLIETGRGKAVNSENWNLRFKENLERLKTGKLEQAAEVVKLLTEREKKKKLSAVEGRLLGMARQIVLSEISMVYEVEGWQAEELLAKWMKIR